MEPTCDNVLSVYRRASFDAFSDGMLWYEDAHNYARTLDSERFHRAAGVIAALSPRSPWNNNKRKAAQFYDRPRTAVKGQPNGIGLSMSVNKAHAIITGTDALDVLTSPKVRAFFLTIVDPHGNHAPVIDRHAFDIAVGEITNDDTRKQLDRKGEYDAFALCYIQAGDAAGISPSQMQAITWMQWRNEKGIYW